MIAEKVVQKPPSITNGIPCRQHTRGRTFEGKAEKEGNYQFCSKHGLSYNARINTLGMKERMRRCPLCLKEIIQAGEKRHGNVTIPIPSQN